MFPNNAQIIVIKTSPLWYTFRLQGDYGRYSRISDTVIVQAQATREKRELTRHTLKKGCSACCCCCCCCCCIANGLCDAPVCCAIMFRPAAFPYLTTASAILEPQKTKNGTYLNAPTLPKVSCPSSRFANKVARRSFSFSRVFTLIPCPPGCGVGDGPGDGLIPPNDGG